MSFQQGLSGLNAAAKQLDVVGNNVANSNTVGFKQARAEFADVYAASITGSGGSQVGIGVKLNAVAQQFTQGNITPTNNSLDIAINGNGFFHMSDNGAPTFTRNGQFQMNSTGEIVDASGKNLMGYQADAAGNLDKNGEKNLVISVTDIRAVATTAVDAALNLDSRSAVIAVPFNITDPTTYNDSTVVTTYDSLGNPHTLQNFFVKTAQAPGSTTWKVFTSVDGVLNTGGATLVFNGTGVAPAISGVTPVTFSPAGASAVSIATDYSKSTQFGSSFSVNNLTADGFTSGQLSKFNTTADGTILGSYTNGQTKVLGQVLLTRFINPNGLQSIGDNAWVETANAGKQPAGIPGSGLLGRLQSSALEDSNVDLTAELVNMITAQRYYQANAQTIKTQDQVLQTLVNLR